ncbi:NUDIX domain-containing protein [Allokutzneria oryzae]|uniref:NUDIX domain-containing protein n=1 Tax=Allokutzneria oryzae TaxID=1378989 RepID=A0ABV6A7Y4_9PSEU
MAAGEHEFRAVNSQDVYAGRVMALRVDDVAMPGGSVAAREVIEHPGAVAVAAVDSDERIVLIHQYRHPVGRRLWELPAGLLDVDGEAPELTAARELAEEAGLAAARWSTLVDVAASPGFTDEVVRVFLARELSTVDRGEIVDDEESDLVVRRVPMREAMSMVLGGEIVNSSSVAGVLAAHAVLTGAVDPRPADAPWRDRPHRWAARRRSR